MNSRESSDGVVSGVEPAPERKRERIDRTLRDEIVRGAYRPGERLPTWDQLARRFGVSRMTVQRGLEPLQRDGFLVAATKRGTSVAPHPPHLMRFGVALPAPPRGARTSSFLAALARAAERVESRDSRRITLYEGIGWRPDPDELARLEADLSGRRIAGLITVAHADQALARLGLDPPGVPQAQVPMGHEPAAAREDRWIVQPDYDAFRDQAVEALRAAGRRRVAVIMPSAGQDDWEARAWSDAVTRSGLATEPHLFQAVPPAEPRWARSCVMLLLALPRAKRPDGLVLADEAFVTPAAEGVSAAGDRVGGALSLVAHWNFPAETDPVAEGVHTVGFDLERLLEACLERIDPQATGAPTAVARIPPERSTAAAPAAAG